MRVSSFMIFNQLTRSFQKNLQSLSGLYNKLSSGKKIDKPSDDVIGMVRAMDYKVSINENDQYKRNIDEAYAHLEFAETTISSASEVLIRAKELAVEGANGTLSAEDRSAIAEEIANLRDQLLSLANSRFRDRYIFSGFKTDLEAFDSSFTYQGDTGEINVMIDRNATIALNVSGNAAFSAGGVTFFETLDDLRMALENDDVTAIQASLTPLDNALGQVLNVRTDIGARLNYLDDQKNRIDDNNFALKTVLSITEDADLAKTASELLKTEATLEALRQSASRVISQSLMDFLR